VEDNAEVVEAHIEIVRGLSESHRDLDVEPQPKHWSINFKA
jgi:hypothetical protein